MNDTKIEALRHAFATVLRKKRNEAKLSQEELGFKAGIAFRCLKRGNGNQRSQRLPVSVMRLILR